jgi:bis(5'-nucleosyl)-tetraphosphatase (symmetrical)
MPPMIHLIGDVQGCDEALGRLLAQIGFSPSRDHIVLLGDLVNRGPDSERVLRRLMSYGSSATSLLGNHDLHLLAAAVGARKLRRQDTFESILTAPDRDELLDWLRQRPLAVQVEGWLCVHAGVAPQWNSDDTLALALEVQSSLRSAQASGLLHAMYGDAPTRWSASLQGPDRWRCLVNILTRIRFCTADGTLDLKSKEGAGDAPAGHHAWFEVPGRRSDGEKIAFGHWSTLGLVNQPDLLGIDTGCVWGGALTAVRVDGGRREVQQVPCPQAQRPGD